MQKRDEAVTTLQKSLDDTWERILPVAQQAKKK